MSAKLNVLRKGDIGVVGAIIIVAPEFPQTPRGLSAAKRSNDSLHAAQFQKGVPLAWGEQYLEEFYKNMTDKHPEKVAVGAAWPSFDDSAAKWGLNRHMQSRCGKTLDDTLRFYQRYFDDARPLPFLLIETWNDYEEGTAVERLSFTQCSESGQAEANSN